MVCICTVTLLFQCHFLFSKGLTPGKGQVWARLDFPFTRYLRPKPQDCLSDFTTLLLLYPPSAHLGSIIPHLLFRARHRHPCSPVLQASQAPCSISHPCPGPGGPVLYLYTEPHGPLSDPHSLCSCCLEHHFCRNSPEPLRQEHVSLTHQEPGTVSFSLFPE